DRRVEPLDRGGDAAQLRFVDAGDERGAREVADFVEPRAEALKEDEELELASRLVEPRRNCGHALDGVEARGAVEVLIERAEKGFERLRHPRSTSSVVA